MARLPELKDSAFLNAVERLVLARDSRVAAGDFVSALLAHANTEDDERFDMAELREEASLAVDEMITALARRQKSVGDAYPLRVDGGALVPIPGWKTGNAYIFLRLIRHHGNPRNDVREAFEFTAASAVAQFFRGKMIRVGDPQRDPVPSNPQEIVVYVSKEIGDGLGIKDDVPYPTSGDLSIDAFIHHRFDEPAEDDDRFISQRLILTVNCATGKEWFKDNKPFEPIKGNPRQYFRNFVSPIWPVFCVPDFDIDVHARQQIGGADTLIFGGWRISRWSSLVTDTARDWVNGEIGKVSPEIVDLPFNSG